MYNFTKEINDEIVKLNQLKKQKQKFEEILDSLNKDIKEISTKTIPDLLLNEGINPEEFSVKTDEYVFSCKKKYFASIAKERKDEAHNWLRENGYGSIIKSNVVIPAGRDENYLCEVAEKLKQLQINYNLEEGVHHSTLKAFVKEQIENGEDIDFDLLGIYIVNEADIKYN
jgi:hypothetical protein